MYSQHVTPWIDSPDVLVEPIKLFVQFQQSAGLLTWQSVISAHRALKSIRLASSEDPMNKDEMDDPDELLVLTQTLPHDGSVEAFTKLEQYRVKSLRTLLKSSEDSQLNYSSYVTSPDSSRRFSRKKVDLPSSPDNSQFLILTPTRRRRGVVTKRRDRADGAMKDDELTLSTFSSPQRRRLSDGNWIGSDSSTKSNISHLDEVKSNQKSPASSPNSFLKRKRTVALSSLSNNISHSSDYRAESPISIGRPDSPSSEPLDECTPPLRRRRRG